MIHIVVGNVALFLSFWIAVVCYMIYTYLYTCKLVKCLVRAGKFLLFAHYGTREAGY